MSEEKVQGLSPDSEPVLYALVDVTEEEGFAFVKRAPIAEIVLWGKIFGMEGRVTKRLDLLTLEQLQYLYWNLTQTPPGEDQDVLFAQCEELSTQVPVDETSAEELRSRIPLEVLRPASTKRREEAIDMGQGSTKGSLEKGEKKGSKKAATEKAEKAPKEAKVKKEKDPTGRPSPGTSTGKVWEIADSLIGKGDVTPARAVVVAACVENGINPATAGVQYGAWLKGMKRSPAPKVEKPAPEKVEKKKAAKKDAPAEEAKVEEETEAEGDEGEDEDEDNE